MTTREEAISLLKKYQEPGDTEVAHAEADKILCALLRDLGYGDVVDEYEKVDKWFA